MRDRRIARLFGSASIVIGVGAAALSWSVESIPLPFTHWRTGGSVGLVAGLAMAALGARSRRFPARWSLAVFSASFALSSVFVLAYHPPRSGEFVVQKKVGRVFVSEVEWYDEYLRPDHEIGHRGIEHVRSVHHSPEFEVTYALDEQGWRTLPRGGVDQRPILFLGCSFTFGVGVDQSEFFPQMLAAGPWRDRGVRSLAMSAYGTNHLYLLLDKELSHQPPPAAVIYAWISRHAERVGRRKSWHRNAAFSFPLFELDQGNLAYRGLLSSTKALEPDGPALDESERQVSLALIQAMRDRCDRERIPFIVLIFEDGAPREHRLTTDLLRHPRLNVHDYRAVSDDLFFRDRHPTPTGHTRIARALTRDQRLAAELGLSDLFQPDAISPTPMPWTLSMLPTCGASARLIRSLGSVRVDQIQLGKCLRYDLSLRLRYLAVKKNQKLAIDFQIRADKPRDVDVNLSQGSAPFGFVGADANLHLNTHWQEVHLEFVPKDDDDNLAFVAFFGSSDAPFELRDLSIRQGNVDVLEAFGER